MRKKLIEIMLFISLLMTYVLVWNSLIMYFETSQAKRISETFQYENQITVQCGTEELEYDETAFWSAVENAERYNLFSVVSCQVGTAAEYKNVTVMLSCNEEIPADINWNDEAASARGGVVIGACSRSLTHERGQKTYLYIGGSEYEVIGWFEEAAAEQIYLFTDGLSFGEKSRISQSILFSTDWIYCFMTLGSSAVENGIINSMYEYLFGHYLASVSGEWESTEIYNGEDEITTMDVVYSIIPGVMAGLLAFCLLNLVMLLNVWMSERSKEAVIKLVYGWRMRRIIFNVQKELFWMLLAACAAGGLAAGLSVQNSVSAVSLNTQGLLWIAGILMGSTFLILALAGGVLYASLRRLQPAALLGKRE